MVRIKIPRTIKIGGFDLSILNNNQISKDLEDRCLIGEHSSLFKEIRLRNTLTPQETSEVFIHEVIHAVASIYLSNGLVESDVKVLGAGLHQVMEELGVRFIQ